MAMVLASTMASVNVCDDDDSGDSADGHGDNDQVVLILKSLILVPVIIQ